jgi:hypothetical protein
MKHKTLLSVFFLVTVIFSVKAATPSFKSDNQKIRISGRLIGKNKKPISNAVVSFFPKKKQSLQLVEFVVTDDNGTFLYEFNEPQDSNLLEFDLYFEKFSGQNNLVLLSAPFDLINKTKEKRYLPLTLRLNDKEDYQLGDLQSSLIEYFPAYIRFNFKDKARIIDSWVKLLDSSGTIVYEGGFSLKEREILLKNKLEFLSLDLPRGKWTLKLFQTPESRSHFFIKQILIS